MKVRYWYASALKHMAKNGIGTTEAKEDLMRIAVAIEAIKPSDLDKEAWICNCGAIIPGTKRQIAQHLSACNGR